MTHTIIHEDISDGQFVGGKKIVTVDSLEKALKYYENTIKKPLSQRIKQQRQKTLQLFDQLKRELGESEVVKSDDADKILSPEKMSEFNKLFSIPDGQKVLKLEWPNLWNNYLYEHIKYAGRRYNLPCQPWKSFNYDVSLVDNNFNDIASSIDTGKLILLVICFQHTWFRGNAWWFFVDDKDFTNNGCNDCISSIACTTVSVLALLQLIQSLI